MLERLDNNLTIVEVLAPETCAIQNLGQRFLNSVVALDAARRSAPPTVQVEDRSPGGVIELFEFLRDGGGGDIQAELAGLAAV